MGRRTAQHLTEEQIEQIAQHILKTMGAPDEGIIFLLDEDTATREARIVSRVVLSYTRMALEFDTRKEYENYKKVHKIAPETVIRILEESSGKGKPSEELEPKRKPDKEPEEREKREPKKLKSPEKIIQERLVDRLGEKEAKGWNTHSVHERQIAPNTTIRFPDGSSKKYKDLSAEEKTRLSKAMVDGLVAHKGLNDYTKVDLPTLKKNMTKNLSSYEDTGIEEKRNDNVEPLSGDNVEEFVNKLKENAGSVLKKYASSMSKISKPMAEGFVDDVVVAISEGVKDGSLAGVSQADLDEHIREDIKRLIHQEIETRARSLGDHGIRHSAVNCRNSINMLNELQKAGIKITGKDKLMALSIQANHDMGYTVGQAAVDVMARGETGHQVNSERLAREESSRYEKIFGKDETEKITHIIRTHDVPEFDWEREPVASSVRLADNIALFGKEKVQDLFIRSPKAMALACKLRLATEAEPENIELHHSIKKQLHGSIDEEDFDDLDRELLHRQIDEMTEEGFSTSLDILSRFSGKVQKVNFDKGSRIMNVDMKYSPEGQTVDALFGDSAASRQFKKFVKDMGGKPIEGKTGKTLLGGDKPSVQINIDGFDEEPIDSATTESMKGFIQKTVRADIGEARKRMVPPTTLESGNVDEALEVLKKSKGKFTDEEWGQVESLFEEKRDNPSEIAQKLAKWPLLRSEREYLEGKVARVTRRLALSLVPVFYR